MEACDDKHGERHNEDEEQDEAELNVRYHRHLAIVVLDLQIKTSDYAIYLI